MGQPADENGDSANSILEGASVPDGRPLDTDSFLVILGLMLLLFVAGATYFERGATERRHALEATAERNAVLAVALAHYTVRVLRTSEAVTQLIAKEYERGVRGPVLTEVLEDRLRNNDVFVGLAVLDASEQVLARVGGPWPAPPELKESVTSYAAAAEGSILRLGRPAARPAGASPVIPLYRSAGGGASAATVVAVVDGNRFLQVFENARVGDDTLIMLIGLDGLARAAWRGASGGVTPLRGATDLKALAAGSARGAVSTGLDGERRVLGLKQLPGYPLVTAVGTLESAALAEQSARQRVYLVGSTVVCSVALLLGVFLIRINRRRNAVTAALDRARSRLRNLNAELEARVLRRTAQLEDANRNLELFSYSVAHDVRAPLSTVDGFAALLQAPVAATGDAKLVRYLSRIRENTKHMGVLTDSLLALAKLSGASVHRVDVDVAAIARTVVNGLLEREPERRVRILIDPGMRAYADAALMRQTMENFLGNAWKFTRHRELADIEVGQLGTQPPTFFVRDNGVGFDMSHAGGLFKPFHRLHTSTEFAGSGIGLATVQRIIALHGGSVWAEGVPDEGATFFFTLPAAPAS